MATFPNPGGYFFEPGYGNFGVTMNGYDVFTTQTQYVAHCIGLGMAGLSFPFAVYITRDFFWVRRRPLFIKRKDRYRAGTRVKEIWRQLPKVVQPVATALLWPLFYSPQPNECLAVCFTFDNIATIVWHILLLTNAGSLPLRSFALELSIIFSSSGLLLHLVGVMRAIPVSSTANLFVSQGSRWQDLLFRLKVPSPSILTAVAYFYSFLHLPLCVNLAWRLGTVTSWDDSFRWFFAHWGQWTMWLALFSVTATVYGLQLIWLLNLNTKDRKALGRDGVLGAGETSQDPESTQGVMTTQQKLMAASSKMVPKALSGRAPSASSPRPSTIAIQPISRTMSQGSAGGPGAGTGTKGITRVQEVLSTQEQSLSPSSATTPISPSASFTLPREPVTLTSISTINIVANGANSSSLRKRLSVAAAEGLRIRSLEQVKQVLIDSPAATMMFVPIHVILIATYGELATNPELAQTWRFIVPVVANIIAHGMSQLKVFVPLFFVVWRDGQARAAARGRAVSSGGGKGTRAGGGKGTIGAVR